MLHIDVCTQPATKINTDRKRSSLTITNSTNGLILFPSLADQDERLLVKKIYTDMYIYTYIERHNTDLSNFWF